MVNIRVILVNNGPQPYYLHRRDNISQIIIEIYVEPNEVVEYISVYFNECGDRGFGLPSD